MRNTLISLLLLCVLCGCNRRDDHTLIVGTIAGPESELVDVAAKVAKKRYGLTITVKEFNDYLMPNIALAEGSIDANVYQHLPYLEQAKKARDLTLTTVGKTFIYPMAAYSKQLRAIADLPTKAIIAIPNDPSNEARALLLLQSAGLIKVSGGSQASSQTITHNPKQLQFKTLDAAQLPRVLDDVALAVINTTFAAPAGLSPTRDGLLVEDKDSPYVNLIVVRTADIDKLAIQQLVKALQSKDVVDKANSLFNGQAIPAFSVSDAPPVAAQ